MVVNVVHLPIHYRYMKLAWKLLLSQLLYFRTSLKYSFQLYNIQ